VGHGFMKIIKKLWILVALAAFSLTAAFTAAGFLQAGFVSLPTTAPLLVEVEHVGARPGLLNGYKGYHYHRAGFRRHDDGWCDAPDDANYNRLVRLPYRASSEVMRRNDALYDIGFILDWNISSTSKKRGSAIFLHLARENLTPTQGCIVLERRDMVRLLPYLRRNRKIIVLR